MIKYSQKEYKMRKAIIFGIGLMISLLFMYCESDTTSSNDNSQNSSRIGYFIEAWVDEGDEDDWDEIDNRIIGYVNIVSSDIPEEIPDIKINDQTGEFDLEDDGILWWEFEDVPINQNVNFKITTSSDVLEGTFKIPDSISAVTCNGQTLSDDEDTQLGLADSYYFQWQGQSDINTFILDCYYYDSIDYDDHYYLYNTFIEGQNYTLIPSVNTVGNYIGFYIRATNSPEIKAGSKPNFESETMFAYLISVGQKSYYYIDIVSSGAAKISLSRKRPPTENIRLSNKEWLKSIMNKLNWPPAISGTTTATRTEGSGVTD